MFHIFTHVKVQHVFSPSVYWPWIWLVPYSLEISEAQLTGGGGKQTFFLPYFRSHPLPAHFSWDNMAANLLDREWIPIIHEHMENACTEG